MLSLVLKMILPLQAMQRDCQPCLAAKGRKATQPTTESWRVSTPAESEPPTPEEVLPSAAWSPLQGKTPKLKGPRRSWWVKHSLSSLPLPPMLLSRLSCSPLLLLQPDCRAPIVSWPPGPSLTPRDESLEKHRIRRASRPFGRLGWTTARLPQRQQ